MNRILAPTPAPAGVAPTPAGSLSPAPTRNGRSPWDLKNSTLVWIRETLDSVDARLYGRLREVDLIRDGEKRLAIVSFAHGPRLALKQYSDDRGVATNIWLERIARAGLAAPGRLRVTAPLGWCPAHNTQIAEVAPGRPWSGWIRAGISAAEAGAAAAEWLLALQRLPVELEDRTAYRSLDGMREETGRLVDAHPGWGVQLRAILEDAKELLTDSAARAPLVPAHGDYHPNNLHLLDGTPTVATALDLDTAGMRRPSYDVGYAIAMSLISSWMHTRSFAAGVATSRAFWRTWTGTRAPADQPTSPVPDADAVPAEIARAFVQSLHFELVTYKTGNDTILPMWLGLARAALGHGVEEMLTTAEVMGS